jgi:DNA-binding GntR family transcriptional regulator
MNRSPEQLGALRETVDREKAARVSDPEVPELNIRFHTELAEASGNRVLAASVAALHRVARPLAFIDTSSELGLAAVRHHIAIVAAVQASDPDAAAEAMQAHLDYLRAHVA